MIPLVSLRWLLTATFTGAAAYHLVRCRRAPPPARVDEALHAVMGLAMVAMLWPSGVRIPAALWITIFAASTIWFAAQAARRWSAAFFATATATMVWMGTTIPADRMPGMPMDRNWLAATLGCYFVAGGLLWSFRGMRLTALSGGPAFPTPAPPDWSALCHAAMSAAMGVAVLAMA